MLRFPGNSLMSCPKLREKQDSPSGRAIQLFTVFGLFFSLFLFFLG